MSRRRLAPLIALAVAALGALALGPVAAHAWNVPTHETIARIAWERMSPQARVRAIALLRAANADADVQSMDDSASSSGARDRELFMRAAGWADVVRDRTDPERLKKYHHASWHFRDGFWQQDVPGGPITDRPDIVPKGENAVSVLEASARALRDPSRPDSLKAIDLMWVMHLVGDIHEPLHASSRITPEDPGGDGGGNRFHLDSVARVGTLHTFWDGALTRHHLRAATDSTLDAYIGHLASALTAANPPALFQQRLSPIDFDAWTKESLAIAKRELYPATLVRNQRPSAEYDAIAGTIAEKAVTLAGYRLGVVLDSLLK